MPSCVIAGYDASRLPPVTALLERYRCKVYIVATAREALRLCQTHKIDLLISRVVFAEEGRMNGMDLVNDLNGRVRIIPHNRILRCHPSNDSRLSTARRARVETAFGLGRARSRD